MGKKGLSDQEQRLASAWIDQELPEAERDYVESRLVEGDNELRDEIDVYRTVRVEFRSWFQREIETESRRVDLWQVIEQELRKKPAARHGLNWNELREKFFAGIRRPVFVSGLAGALAVAVVVFVRPGGSSLPAHELRARGASGPVTSGARLAGAKVPAIGEQEAIEIASMQDGAASPERPTLVSTSRPGGDLLSRLPVPDAISSRLLSSPQLIVDNQIHDGQVPGGFRTGNTDIEWIKTNKPFKLVASRQRQAPPVIWIARATK